MRRLAIPAVLIAAAVVFALITLRTGDEPPEPANVSAAGPRFSSIAEMTDASDLVVEGTIISSEAGRRITDPTDPDVGLISRLHQLEVREVFRGRAGELVLLEQEATLLDGTPIMVNGLTPHDVGDTGFWFLVFGGSEEFPFAVVVNEQGRLLVSPADTIQSPLFAGVADADELRAALRASRRDG